MHGVVPFLTYCLMALATSVAFCLTLPKAWWLKAEDWCEHHEHWILWGAFGTYLACFLWLTLSRHFLYESHHLDLSPMAQSMYQTLQGNILNHTWEDGINRSRLASGTWELILILIAPLFLIWKNAAVLLIIQTITIASGVFPLARIIKHLSDSKLHFAVGILFYVWFTPIHFVNIFDFHPYGMAIPGFLWLLYAMLTQRWKLFYLSGLYILVCRSDLAVAGLGIGLYLIAFSNHRRHGLIFFAINLIIFIAIKEFLAFRIESLPKELYTFSHHKALGENTWDIAKHMVLHPWQVFTLMTEERKVFNFLSLIILTGGTCFLRPKFLISLLSLLIVWYTPRWELSAIYTHHHAAIDVILIVATVWGVAWAHHKLLTQKSVFAYLPIAYLFCCSLGGLVSTPLMGTMVHKAKEYLQKGPHLKTHRRFLKEAFSLIPPDAAVSAQSNLSPHIPFRKTLFLFPVGLQPSDQVLLDISEYNNVFHMYGKTAVLDTVAQLKKDSNWYLRYDQDGVLLFERQKFENR